MSLDFATLFGGLVVSAIGFAALQVGRRRASPGKIGIGILLMVLPLLLDGWALWLTGGALCAALWVVP